jgi:hypothetical protein
MTAGVNARAGIVSLVVAGALGAAGPALSAETPRTPEYWVREATIAVQVYYEDHAQSFTGMTVAGLREWVPVKHIRVVRATRRTFCIESRLNGLSAFWDGLDEPVKRGTCANARAGRELPIPKPKSKPRPVETSAMVDIRSAIPAIEAYYVDHDGYLGMSIEVLRADYDAALPEITFVRAGRRSYCVEAVHGRDAAYKSGPAAPIRKGRCPR